MIPASKGPALPADTSGPARPGENGRPELASESVRRTAGLEPAELQVLLSMPGVGVWRVDNQFRTVWANAQMAAMLGCSPDRLVSRQVWDFIPPEEREAARQLWARRLAAVPESHEFRFVREDGRHVWALVSAVPLLDPQGQVAGATAVVTDITSRKLIELRERFQRTAIELAVANLPLADSLESLAELGASTFPGLQFAILSAPLRPSPLVWRTLASSAGAAERAEALARRWSEPTPPDSLSGSPADGSFLEVDSPQGERYRIVPLPAGGLGEPARDLQPILENLALALHLAICRSETIENLRQVTARLEERISAKQQTLQQQAAAMDATVEGMAILQDGRYVYLNPAHAVMYGYRPEQLLGESWERLYDPAERARVEAEAFPALRASGTWNGEVRGRRADGSTFDVEVNLTLCPSGELVCTCRDITERRQQAEALRRSEEQLSLVLESTEDGFWDWDIPNGTTTFSPRWLEMLGYQPGELAAHIDTWRKLVHPEDRDEVFRKVDDLLAGRTGHLRSECRLRSRSGSWRWILSRGKVVHRDPQGRPLRAVGVHTDITTQRQLQDILTTVLEAGEIGFWDHDVAQGRIRRQGHGWRRLGYRPEDVPEHLGQFSDTVHPDERTALMESYARYLEHPEGRWDYEFRMRGHSGEYRWVFTRAQAIERNEEGRATRVIGIHLDVNDRHSELFQIQWQGRLLSSIGDAQRRFLEGEKPTRAFDALLKALLDLTDSQYGFIAEVHHDGNTPFMRSHAMSNIAWNEETRRLFEQAQQNGMEFRNLDTLFGRVLTGRELVIANDAPNDPRRGGIPNGHPPLDRFMGIPVFSGNELVGVVGLANRPQPYTETLARDVEPLIRTYGSLIVSLRRESERLETGSALQRRTNELIEANAALERAARGRDEFLASMSHELRTPLTTMLALTEVLRDDRTHPLSDTQARHIQNIEESGRHLLDLINDVLEVARLEARLVRVDPIPCLVRDIIEASVRLVRAQAQGKRLFLQVDPGPPGLMVQADPLRLKQILTNLLSNAVKFTAPGGHVRLVARADGDAVRFGVEDTGIGIPPEKLRLLFQPFVQIETGLARRYSGSGLGLVIVKRFAELLAGCVSVESSPGQGSRFTVSLPSATVVESAQAPARPAVAPAPDPDGARVRALIVEDNELNRSVLADYLSTRGFDIATAEDGLQALEKVRTFRPQVVVMDIQMPEIDGLEVSRRIREMPEPEIARVPILALTALAMPGDRERCLAAGVTDYLSKPFALKDLARRLQELAQTRTSSVG